MSGEKIWFIGDTHFNHRMIISYCDRPFATVSEMNEAMIDNWNKVVRKEDKVIMNGDFALSGKDKIIEIGQQLNGRKTLVLGNHDGASLKTYYDAGFEMVSKYPIVVEEFFIVSHKPQYTQENGVYVNIFAHVHGNPAFKDVSSRSFCTSAERINYTPILFEDIKAQIQAVCDKEREE
jgi:calcineurin-like phosphoesterase family protein